MNACSASCAAHSVSATGAYQGRPRDAPLATEFKPKLDTLPKDDVYGPVDQSDGELAVLAPDRNPLAFGQHIHKT